MQKVIINLKGENPPEVFQIPEQRKEEIVNSMFPFFKQLAEEEISLNQLIQNCNEFAQNVQEVAFINYGIAKSIAETKILTDKLRKISVLFVGKNKPIAQA